MYQRRSQGVSLLEALLALFVVGIAFTALYKLQANSFRYQGESKTKTIALAMAQEQVEDLRASLTTSEFTASASHDSEESDNCDPTEADSPCQGANAVLSRTWGAENCAAGLACQAVNVKVVWQDAANQTQSVIINSVLSTYERVKSGVVLAN